VGNTQHPQATTYSNALFDIKTRKNDHLNFTHGGNLQIKQRLICLSINAFYSKKNSKPILQMKLPYLCKFSALKRKITPFFY